MARARIFAATLALVTVAGLAPAYGQQAVTFDISAGYQWLDLSGNRDMYKSQINESDGFVLRNLTLLVTNDEKRTGIFDRIRLDAFDLGASPQSRVHFEARRDGVVGVRMDYFRGKHFSSLPAFANPFLADGIVPGEHTVDRTIESFDVEVKVLPWKAIRPVVGWRWERLDGPSRTTVTTGGDEFRLNSDLRETTNEVRAGFEFEVGTFHGSVIRGWRSVDSRDRMSLVAGAGGGNSSRTVLGHDPSLDDYARMTRASIDTDTTLGTVTGRIGDRVRLVATYLSGDIDSTGSEDESLTGDLVSFQVRSYFTALEGTTASRISSPYWRGNARLELDVVSGVQLSAGYTKRHRELDGRALIDELYLGVTGFGGLPADDIEQLLSARTAFEREDEVADARLDVRNLGPVHLWAGYQQTKQNVTITPDAAEIVVPGNQGGMFDRTVDRALGGAALKAGGFDVSAEFQHDSADRAIVRTDLIDRDRWRLRAGWGDGRWVRFIANANLVKGENNDPGIGYDFNQKQWGGDLEITPVAQFAITGTYSKFKTDTTIPIRLPQDFKTVDSVYAEDGELVGGGLSWRSESWSLEGGYSEFKNSGDAPLSLKRSWARASVDLSKAFGIGFEFDDNDYTENVLALANYTARRYLALLRWHN